MKKKNNLFPYKIVLLILLSLATVCVSAQQISGDISPLKGQREINLVIDFTGTWVNSSPEESYIAGEIKNKTEEQKTEWLTEWNEYLRENAYAKFITFFNKKMETSGMLVGNFSNAKYTMHIQVKEIYVGWYGGVVGSSSKVITDIKFIKKGENIPFASITEQCSQGMDFWFINRIAYAFGDLGKKIAKSMVNFTPTPTSHTQDIISICNIEIMNNEFVASWNRAMQICPDGWRLPTSEELKCMCENKKTKKNNSALELRESQYWTSDRAKDPDKAVSRTINDCKVETEEKTDFLGVRCVRK